MFVFYDSQVSAGCCGFNISRGQLSKLVQKASAAFEQAYNELLGYLPYEARLNVDRCSWRRLRRGDWLRLLLDIALSDVPDSRPTLHKALAAKTAGPGVNASGP